MFENQAIMDGFAPEVEERGNLPQVKRKLIIRAEKSPPSAMRCSVTISSGLRPARPDSAAGRRRHQRPRSGLQLCTEWAEHARFDRDDDPCDDGRAGEVCDEEIASADGDARPVRGHER
jgi:hypothetical protein